MRITQALVAVGGQASRLRKGGVEVAVSKSFMPLLGKPFLHWNLSALYTAGVRRLVLAADSSMQLHEAEFALAELAFAFDEVVYFEDPGLGVHGLPFQARQKLDRELIFECGHSLIRPAHYRRLVDIKHPDNVAVSGFTPHPDNPRQPVRLAAGHVRRGTWWRPGRQAIAHPFVIDSDYVDLLPRLDFRIDRIIRHYADPGRMGYVLSDMPPEFDLAQELRESTLLYERYLSSAPDFWTTPDGTVPGAAPDPGQGRHLP